MDDQPDVRDEIAVTQAKLESNPTVGKPTWTTDDNPDPVQTMDRVDDFFKTHALAGRTWDEAASHFQQRFPGLDPSSEKDRYPQYGLQAKLDVERQKAAEDVPDADLDASRGLKAASSWWRGPATAAMYSVAKDRFNKGTADKGDLYAMARYEREQQFEAQASKSIGGDLYGKAMAAPGYAGAMLLGGGAGAAAVGGTGLLAGAARLGVSTLATPSLYAEQAFKTNTEQGRNPLDPRALPTPLAMAAIQTAVLGAAGQWAQGVANPVTRFMANVGLGTAAQEGANVVGGLLDEVLPKAYKTNTGYGLLGSLLLRGDTDEALKQGLTDILMQSAFTALHGNKGHVDPVNQIIADSLNDSAKKGYSTAGPPPGSPPGSPSGGQRVAERLRNDATSKAREWLGVDANATPEDIQKAYQSQGAKTHPDRGGSDYEFSKVQWAYDFLTQPPPPAKQKWMRNQPADQPPAEQPTQPSQGEQPQPPEQAPPQPTPQPPEAAAAAPQDPAGPEVAPQAPVQPTEAATQPVKVPSDPRALRRIIGDSGGFPQQDPIFAETRPEEPPASQASTPEHLTEPAAETPPETATVHPGTVEPKPDAESAVRKAGFNLDEAWQHYQDTGEAPDLPSIFKAANLNPAEQRVIRERLGDPANEVAPKSLADIGKAMGVSRERARQIEAKARGKLGVKSSLEAETVKPDKGSALLDAVERGTLNTGDKLTSMAEVFGDVDPETGKRLRAKAKDHAQRLEDAKEDATDKVIEDVRAAKEAGASPEQIQSIWDSLESETKTQLRKAKRAKRKPSGDEATPSVGGETGGRNEATPASEGVQRRTGGEVPPGAETPAGVGAETAEAPAATGLTPMEKARRARSIPKEYEAQATELGIDPEHLHSAAKEFLKTEKEHADQIEAAVKTLREALHREYYKGLSKIGFNKKIAAAEDVSQIKGFDVAANEVMHEHRNLFQTEGRYGDKEATGDEVQVLFDYLQGRNPQTGAQRVKPTEEDAYSRALNYLADRSVADAARATLQSGFPATAAQEVIRRGESAGQGESLHGEASDSGHAGDVGDFDPAEFEQPGQPNEPEIPGVARSVLNVAKDFLEGEAGHLDVEALHRGALALAAKAAPYIQAANDHFKELAGQMVPRTTRINREAGEALARFVHAATYAKLRTPRLIDKVLGPKATEADRKLYGAVMTEWHLRYTKLAYKKKAAEYAAEGARLHATDPKGSQDAYTLAQEAQRLSDNVTSTIGKPWSPLTSKPQYDQLRTSPRFQGILKGWRDSVVPEMESNFRKMSGMEDTDPIDSFTQVPDHPMNLIGSPSKKAPGGGGKSPVNFANLRLGKNPFENQRKGDAEEYNIDLGDIIENSIRRGHTLATKAEAIKAMEDGGVGKVDDAGQSFEGYRRFDFHKPGKAFYVKNEAAGEWEKANDLATHPKLPLLSDAMAMLSKTSLASTVEAAYHTSNLMTQLIKADLGAFPGTGLFKFATNAAGLIAKKPELLDRIVELARIGAQKDFAASGGSTLNPLQWSARFLHLVNDAARLTMEDSFNRLRRQGRAVNTETNRRDFINQLGQYNQKAQNVMVSVARDLGIGPFSTAGTVFAMQGQRALTGSVGLKSPSVKQAIGLRAEYLARIAAILAATAAANFVKWGRADGDDNTPMFALKLGDDGKGRTSYFNFAQTFTPFIRGMREFGLLALAEGNRKGATEGKSADKAIDAAAESLLHPFFGPGVQFGWTAMTGKNTLGRQLSEKAGYGESQHWRDLKAAVMNANPTVATFSGADRPGQDVPAAEKAAALAGPFGPRFSGPHKPQAVLNLYEALDADEETHKQASRDAMKKGLTAPSDRVVTVLKQAATQISTLERRFNSEGTTSADRDEIRQRQTAIAERAMEVRERFRKVAVGAEK